MYTRIAHLKYPLFDRGALAESAFRQTLRTCSGNTGSKEVEHFAPPSGYGGIMNLK